MKGITIPKVMKELVAAKANIVRIQQQWPDIIRLIASIITHRIVPSDILRLLMQSLKLLKQSKSLLIYLQEPGLKT